jgi:hypothetical protein
VQEKPDLFAPGQVGPSEIIDVEQFLFAQGYYDGDLENTFSRPPVSPVTEILAMQRDGVISEEEATARINDMRSQDLRNDFLKYIYRPSKNQQYSVQLDGGSPMAKYLFAFGYDNNLSTLVGNNFERFTVRSENSVKANRFIEFNFGVMYSQGNSSNNSPGEYGSPNYASRTIGSLPVYASLVDINGKAAPIPKEYRLGYLDTVGGGRLMDWHYRPLDEMRQTLRTTLERNLLVNAGMSVSVLSSLTGSLKYQYQQIQQNSSEYYGPGSYYTRNLINLFYDSTKTDPYVVPRGAIEDKTMQQVEVHNIRGQLNFNKGWKRHRVNTLLGGEIRERRALMNGFGQYGVTEFLTSAQVDYVNYYRTYGDIWGDSRIPYFSRSGDQTDRFASAYFNGAYTFDDRYVISASARKDASNLFGVRSNQKGRPLWSAGGAWNISKEKFYHVKWMNHLKARITYGFSGNLNKNHSAYTVFQLQNNSQTNIINVPVAVLANSPNPGLRWEKLGMLNAGIDFAMFNGRLNGSIEYFVKKTRDLFGREAMDPTTGIISMETNSAHTRGRGIDVQLGGVIINGAFRWESSFLLSYSKTIITRYLLEPSQLPGAHVGNGQTLSPVVGAEPYVVTSYPFAGLDPLTGDPLGYLDKEISTDYGAILAQTPLTDLVYHGSSVPHYFGNFRNTVFFKGVSVSANIGYRLNYYFRFNSFSSTAFYAGLFGHSDYYRRWQTPGDELQTSVPAAVYPVNYERDELYLKSPATVERGDHIRLQDLRIDYQLPDFSMLPVKNIRVYGYVNNINALLWKKNSLGLDPDNPGGVPLPRSWSVGVSAQF